MISQVGEALYDAFFAGYTRKQWGRDPKELDPSICNRIVRTDRTDTYFTDEHQAMPADGYTALFTRLLDHPQIEVLELNRLCAPGGPTPRRPGDLHRTLGCLVRSSARTHCPIAESASNTST